MSRLELREGFRCLRRYDDAVLSHLGFASTLNQRLWSMALCFDVVFMVGALGAVLSHDSSSHVILWSGAMWLLGIPIGMLTAYVWLGERPQRSVGGRRRSALRLIVWTMCCTVLPILSLLQ
jgi:hypothetical protein